MTYAITRSIAETVALLAASGGTIVAGGTDFYPARVGAPLVENVIDVSALSELRGISRDESGLRIGAMTTWSDIVKADLPPRFDGLRAAAREVGSLQIQNAGTIGGNLCNASPAADGVPPLLTLDATVELTSVDGTRVLPLQDFITGYRRTARQPHEMVTAVLVPAGADEAVSRFLKLGSRRYLVISIVMVATLLESAPDGKITAARVAVGACTPVAVRATQLEADLIGMSLVDDLAAVVSPDHLAMLEPIDDVRASAGYRATAALELVKRSLGAA